MKTGTILLLALILLASACKKDEDDPAPQNYFEVDGSQYELTNSYLANGGIYLFSGGLSITGLEQTTNNPILKGTGNQFSISAINGQEPVKSGTYSLAQLEGEVFINYNPALTTSDYHQLLNGGTGTCQVSLEGLDCTVSLEGTLPDGKKLTARFSGTLTAVAN